MKAILQAQWRRLLANPFYFVIMLVLSVVLSLVIGGQSQDRIRVQALPDPSLSEAEAEHWLDLLQDSNTFRFVFGDEERVLRGFESGTVSLAVRLLPDDFRVLASETDPNLPGLVNHLSTTYAQELTIRALGGTADGILELRGEVAARLQEPALRLVAVSEEDDQGFAFDSRVHALLGMGLLFAMFTIFSSMQNMLEDRRIGVWDRVIISPTSRFSMYWGHMTFSFLQGMLQVGVVFSLFHFVFGVRIGDSPLLTILVLLVFTFTMVALGMLVAGLVSNTGQMSVAIPIVAVSSAMLGGAYWPREIVTNDFLLAASNFVPLTYALESFKGLAYYSYGLPQLLPHLTMLFLIGVVCMGIGLMLVERRG